MSSSGCRAAATEFRHLDQAQRRPSREAAFSFAAAGAGLDRWAWDCPVRTKYAAVAGLRLQPCSACPAVIEELAGVDRHRLGGLMAASRAGDGGLQLHSLPPVGRT